MLPLLKDSVALTAGWKSSVPRKLDAERRGRKHVLKIDLERRNQPNVCHPRGPILQILLGGDSPGTLPFELESRNLLACVALT